MFGQKRRHLAPLSYPGLLDLAFKCYGQHPRPYEVIEGNLNIDKKNQIIILNNILVNIISPIGKTDRQSDLYYSSFAKASFNVLKSFEPKFRYDNKVKEFMQEDFIHDTIF